MTLNYYTAWVTCKSPDVTMSTCLRWMLPCLWGLVTVLVDALVKYTSPDCIRPFVPTVLSPSCPDIGLPTVNPVELQADLVHYILLTLPGAADTQYFWENALEPCLGVLLSLGSVYTDSDVLSREEPPMNVTPYFAMLGEL